MRNKNTRTTRRMALAIIMVFLITGSIAATSFHLGGGYSYTMLDYSFDSLETEKRVEGKSTEHEITVNTAAFLGRTNSFGLGLDFSFRLPSKSSFEAADTKLLPWGIGTNISLIARTPFTSSGAFGMHTKLGAGITYRKSKAECYPLLYVGADEIEDLDIRLLTGIGFYADIAKCVSISAGMDFNVSLSRMFKASGTKGVENFNTPNYLKFDHVLGHEVRGYVAVSYIFTNRG